MSDRKSMITYRRVDGKLILDEYTTVSDPDPYTDGEWKPVEYYKETWQLLDRQVHVEFPTLYSCQHPDCDDDAEEWVKWDGEWTAVCCDHRGEWEDSVSESV